MREQIVQAARSLIGVPFKHQGRNPQSGLDCAGVIIAAYGLCGIALPDQLHYGRLPDSRLIKYMLDENFVYTDKADSADILLIKFTKQPRHLAIVTDMGIIHSYEKIGKVVEHRLNDVWRKRIVMIYTAESLWQV